jgi:ketosteroid isomerase-like protein
MLTPAGSIARVDLEAAQKFAASWEQAWNAHDLDAMLAHFAQDVVFSSPVAVRIVPRSDGVLHGREALRAYWAEGLRLIPDLHFVVLDVFAGIDVLVLAYQNQLGNRVCEVLKFDGELVVEGHGTYLIDGGDDVSRAVGAA